MQTILQKILHEYKHTPNPDLEHVLFVRVQKRIQTVIRIQLISYYTIGIFSSISLVWYAHTLYNELSNSGVYTYLYLLIGEDITTLSLVSKEILYVIVESLPVMSMTLSLGLLFMFMISINGVLMSLQRGRVYNITNY